MWYNCGELLSKGFMHGPSVGQDASDPPSDGDWEDKHSPLLQHTPHPLRHASLWAGCVQDRVAGRGAGGKERVPTTAQATWATCPAPNGDVCLKTTSKDHGQQSHHSQTARQCMRYAVTALIHRQLTDEPPTDSAHQQKVLIKSSTHPLSDQHWPYCCVHSAQQGHHQSKYIRAISPTLTRGTLPTAQWLCSGSGNRRAAVIETADCPEALAAASQAGATPCRAPQGTARHRHHAMRVPYSTKLCIAGVML
jgi:hypothetical protein